jgi:hypothetical protein
MSVLEIMTIFHAYERGESVHYLAQRCRCDRRLIHWAIDEALRRRRRLAVANG